MTTPDALKLAANLRDWAEDAEEHNSHFVPLTAKTLLMCSSTIEQQHAALESLRSEVQEQARLNGMGAERELALIARQNELMRQVESLRAGRAVPDGARGMERVCCAQCPPGFVVCETCEANGISEEDAEQFGVTRVINDLAAPTPPQAEQAGKGEPVAWMMEWPNHSPSFTTDKSDYVSWFMGKAIYPDGLKPLYTHPAQQPDDARDARRYRRLRGNYLRVFMADHTGGVAFDIECEDIGLNSEQDGARLDAAIDAALTAQEAAMATTATVDHGGEA